MRKSITAAIVLAVVFTSTIALAATTPGVTPKEIKLGITYVDLAPVKDIVHLDHGDYQAAYNAVIDDLNSRGGINGRKIVPVYAPINPIGTVPADQACTKLTEDEHVFAAVGFFTGDAPLCFVEQHDTPIIGGTMTAERLQRAKAPWFTFQVGDATTGQLIDAFAADGQFKGKKVAVIDATADDPLTKDVVLPALKRNKVKVVDSGVIDTPADDPVAAQQRAGVIAQKFQSDGANVVVVVGTATVSLLKALANSNYHPRIVATDQTQLSGYVNDKSADPAVLKGAVTGGYTDATVLWKTPEIAKCVQLDEQKTGSKVVDPSAKLQPGGASLPDTYVSPIAACQNIGLFASIAKAAGKNLTVASFEKAVKSPGTVTIPGYGAVSYDPKTRAYNLPIFILRFDPAKKLMVADTNPVKLAKKSK